MDYETYLLYEHPDLWLKRRKSPWMDDHRAEMKEELGPWVTVCGKSGDWSDRTLRKAGNGEATIWRAPGTKGAG